VNDLISQLPSAPDLNATDFPSPWTIRELEACFVVIDRGGHKLAFVYHEDEVGRRADAKLLSKDQARQIAANVVKLPDLLRKQ